MTDRQDAEAAKALYKSKTGQPLSVDPTFVADSVLDPIIAAAAMGDEVTTKAQGDQNTADITALQDGKVNSVTAGTPNVSITGTPTDPVINVVQTEAGLLTNVYFTADEVTTTEGTFYKVLIAERGTTPSAIQTVQLDDNETGPFPQDFLGDPASEDRPIFGGVYAGFPVVQINIGQSNQRFKIEAYICDGEGAPLGIGDGPVGTLGVNTVLVADSGIIDLQPNNPTSVNCQGQVPNTLTLLTGQRFRYVVIAEKVGTGGGVKTFSLFSGSDYNSYFQIPTGGTGSSAPANLQQVLDTGNTSTTGLSIDTSETSLDVAQSQSDAVIITSTHSSGVVSRLEINKDTGAIKLQSAGPNTAQLQVDQGGILIDSGVTSAPVSIPQLPVDNTVDALVGIDPSGNLKKVEGAGKSRYVINYAKAGTVDGITVLDTHSSFTNPTGFYFGTGLDAALVGIRFTSGQLQAQAVGEFRLDVRYDEAGSPTQHTVGTGTQLTEETLYSAAGLTAPLFNESAEVFFTPIPLVQDKVYFVDVSVITFIEIIDLSVELIIEV